MALEKMEVRDVLNHYGPRTIDQSKGGIMPGDGYTRHLTYTFTYDNLPSEGETNLEMQIPAYAKIVGAYLEILEGFAGDGSDTIDIGLNESDGTEIDEDGLFAAVAEGDIDSRGDYVEGDGDLVGASIGSEAGEVVVTGPSSLTAGKARLVVEFVPEGAGA